MSKLTLAILGHGTVGRSLATLAQEEALGLNVKYILRRTASADDARVVTDFSQILADPEVSVIADALPGAQPSYDYIRAALAAGKGVVTANKAAVAKDIGALTALAKEKRVPLLFEASVGGGLPIIETIKRFKRTNCIDRVSGILNGTCNYILDAMQTDGISFETALKEAQRLGYAEADPTTDISGMDVYNKAVIACSLAFGAPITAPFPVSGIVGVTAELIEGLKRDGKSLRLMLLSRATAGRYALGVVPVVLPASSPAGSLRKNLNLAELHCSVRGPVNLIAQGAGGLPTADAMLEDLMNIRHHTYEEVTLDGSLQYDPSLLTGRAYLGGDVLATTLENACSIARVKGAFLAFEPDFQD